MDSVSQFVLGASIGEVVLGKKLGNKAMLWGGIAGTIPDLDVITRPFLDIVEEVAFHRSISHSILLFLFLAPFLGYLLQRFSKNNQVTFWEWTHLFFWGFFTHALLDCFTTWGTQLFWPLKERIAWKTIFVVDPVYTLPFIVVLILIAFKRKDSYKRRVLNYSVLAFTTTYLLFTVLNKSLVNEKFSKMAQEDGLEVQNLDSRPAPLQNILWTANVETRDAFHIYYYSWFDNQTQSGYSIPKNHHLLQAYEADDRISMLKEISEGFYTIQKTEKGIIFNDLRFGQTIGWIDPTSPFVFAYRIEKKGSDVIIEEVEKDIKQATNSLSLLANRIMGKF